MAPVIIERNLAATDAVLGGTSAVSRVFLVTETDAVSARSLEGLPERGDTHPTLTTLLCDRVIYRDRGDGHVDVIADYSNDRRFSRRSIPGEDVAGYYRWNIRTEKVQVDIPELRLGTVDDESGTATTRWYVDPDRQPWDETRLILQLRIKGSSLGGSSIANAFATWDNVRAQINRLHTINSVDVVLRDAYADQVDDDLWDLVYEWMYDAGTTIPYQPVGTDAWFIHATNYPNSYGTDNYRLPSTESVSDGAIGIRLPYHKIAVEFDPENPEDFPTVYQQLAWDDSDPTGWQDLPGIATP